MSTHLRKDPHDTPAAHFGSPRGAAAESLEMAEHSLGAVRDVRPDVEIDTFDR
jgi:hypothetical protein